MDTRVSLEVQNADLVGVLKVLCEQAGFEYQFSSSLLAKVPPDSLVTAKVKDRPMREVVETLLAPVSSRMLLQGNTLFFGSQAEVDDKKNRLPVVQRSYQPRYLSIKQTKEILAAHFKRDFEKKLGVDIAAEDPRDKTRLLLVGTSEDVSTVLGALARYDVPESGEAAASSEAGGGGNKTQIFRLQYLDPQLHTGLITESIRQLYGEGETAPSIYLDTTTRTVVVTTQLKYLRKIEKLLARLDVRPEQVNIEGKIVEVNQTVSRQLGINWTAFQQQGANTSANAQFAPAVSVDFISQLSYSTISNGTTIQATLDALLNERKADLVSAPNITVNDNETASIVTADSLVTLRSTREVTGNTVITTTEASTFEVPLSLKVTPKISRADRRVAMKILFNLRTATGAPAAAGAPPPTSQQTADTNVNVNSGETAVIGGLVRQNNLFTERKVPILGDIPLLGMLFRFESESKDKKEVIIFITPTIVED
jgi:type II secretory pathway component GspD/PulD (secretin)